jgi:hypothetical protein
VRAVTNPFDAEAGNDPFDDAPLYGPEDDDLGDPAAGDALGGWKAATVVLALLGCLCLAALYATHLQLERLERQVAAQSPCWVSDLGVAVSKDGGPPVPVVSITTDGGRTTHWLRSAKDLIELVPVAPAAGRE